MLVNNRVHFQRVKGFYAPDPDVVIIGTNIDQKKVGSSEIREAFQEDFEAFGKAGIEITWHSVSAEGDVAWVASEGRAFFEIDGDEVHARARLTAVMVRRGERWLIMQSHLSFPADETGGRKPDVAL